MKKIIISFAFLFLITTYSQSWHSYNNRIPAWPKDINESSVESFKSSLQILKVELQDKTLNTMARYENLTQAEAMKLAQEYQKNMSKMSPQEIARRSQLSQNYTDVEFPEEIALDQRLAVMKNEFDEKIHDEINKLRAKFPCEAGLGETNCDVLSAEFKKLADKLSAEYFVGNKAKLRSIIDEVNDYMIKKKLPVTEQREKDQYELLGDKSATPTSGLSIVEQCIDHLLYASERMEWLVRLKADDNYFYYPGQVY